MKNNQKQYIEYIKRFAEENECHIWLSGSFSNGTATEYSDIDISVYCDAETVNRLVYSYGEPAYISFTQKPLGILIVIYKDGVAVDLEVIEKLDMVDNEFFHTDDIKLYNYLRNEKLCKELSLKDDIHYQISRLFHRSLIKFLSEKHDLGISIANEIVSFCNVDIQIDVSNYKIRINELLEDINNRYQLPIEYNKILIALINELDS